MLSTVAPLTSSENTYIAIGDDLFKLDVVGWVIHVSILVDLILWHICNKMQSNHELVYE